MKQLKKLSLSKLTKNRLSNEEMDKVHGGYCAWGPENKAANDYQGLCSCDCSNNEYNSYRNDFAGFYKNWG